MIESPSVIDEDTLLEPASSSQKVNLDDVNNFTVGRLKCQICSKNLSSEGALLTHIKSRHIGEKPYHCNSCQRNFAHKHSYLQHANIHLGLRPYRCQYCKKTFTASSNLSEHKKIHMKQMKIQDDNCHTYQERISNNENRHNFVKGFSSDDSKLNDHKYELCHATLLLKPPLNNDRLQETIPQRAVIREVRKINNKTSIKTSPYHYKPNQSRIAHKMAIPSCVKISNNSSQNLLNSGSSFKPTSKIILQSRPFVSVNNVVHPGSSVTNLNTTKLRLIDTSPSHTQPVSRNDVISSPAASSLKIDILEKFLRNNNNNASQRTVSRSFLKVKCFSLNDKLISDSTTSTEHDYSRVDISKEDVIVSLDDVLSTAVQNQLLFSCDKCRTYFREKEFYLRHQKLHIRLSV